jgi:hypothetical protein
VRSRTDSIENAPVKLAGFADEVEEKAIPNPAMRNAKTK